MTTIIMPPDLHDSFSRVVLNNTEYLIRFTYNDAGDYWTFGLMTASSVRLRRGSSWYHTRR